MSANSFGLDHIAYPVYDAAATFEFYTKILGLILTDAHAGGDWGGKPWLMMIFDAGDGRKLALCALRGAKRPKKNGPDDILHFAFSAPGLAEWKKRLRAAKVKFTEEDHGNQKSIYFSDPSGTVLEITSPGSAKAMKRNPRAAAKVTRWLKAADTRRPAKFTRHRTGRR